MRDAYTATDAAPRTDCRVSARQTYSEILRGVGAAFAPPAPWTRGWEPSAEEVQSIEEIIGQCAHCRIPGRHIERLAGVRRRNEVKENTA